MTTSEKIDFLYSKFVEIDRSQTSVFNSQIWTQGDQIPQTLPSFDVNGEYKNTSGQTILKMQQFVRMAPVSGFPNAFSSPNVFDVVSYESGFDQSYKYKFYTKSSNGSYIEIPFGQGDYFFDHDTGILFFPQGRSPLYNPSSLYITFVQYVGSKGISTTSQFSGSPEPGPVGPTGPTGSTGETGPSDAFSLRYKGSWSSSVEYSKWDIVKYGGRFFLSTIGANQYTPDNGTYWQAFGVPQLSTNFNTPDETYWISPSFLTPGSGRFNSIEAAVSDMNSGVFTDTTVTIYPGEYEVNSNLVIRPGLNINFVFHGRVRITFRDDSLSTVFSNGSKIELIGNDFAFTNGIIRIIGSSLSVVGGSLADVQLVTTTLADTSRLRAVNSQISYLTNYGSFASLTGTNIVNKITMDEVSVLHMEGCMVQARPLDDPGQEKIEIVSSASSGTPPGFGYQNPALFIKNCRILSNGPVLYSTILPSYGFQLGIISSALYVTDSSTSFLDFSDAMDAFIFNSVVNTAYDDTKLIILNVNGQFQTIAANFED